MRKFNKVIAVALVLVFTLVVSGCFGKTVATVNGVKISEKQLQGRMDKVKASYADQGADFKGQDGEMMLKALEQQTLDTMIQEVLIKEDAKKLGVMPTKKEIEEEIKKLKDRFKSEEEYKQALKQYKMDEDFIEEWITNNLAYQKLQNKVTANITVKDEDIKKYYEDNKTTEFKEPDSIKVRHILIKFDTAETKKEDKVNRDEKKALAMAKDILKQLQGGDFAKIAKEKSEDTMSAAQGGLLDMTNKGTVTKNQTVPEFEKAAFALGIGQMTKEPVKTQYGYHIIKVEGKYPAKQLKFEEVKEQIKKELPDKKKDEFFRKYIEDLKSKAKIDNKVAEKAPAIGGGMPGGVPSQSK